MAQFNRKEYNKNYYRNNKDKLKEQRDQNKDLKKIYNENYYNNVVRRRRNKRALNSTKTGRSWSELDSSIDNYENDYYKPL